MYSIIDYLSFVIVVAEKGVSRGPLGKRARISGVTCEELFIRKRKLQLLGSGDR
jgi:hypothetical protein